MAEVANSAGARGSAIDRVPLATRINALHREVQAHKAQMLLKARAAGELLLEQKRYIPHGEWMHWLTENFEGSGRTARAYMRIARYWDVLSPKWQSTANMSIAEALELLRYGYQDDDDENESERGA